MQLKTAIDCMEAACSVRGSHLDVYGRRTEENLLVYFVSKVSGRTVRKQTDVPKRLTLADCWECCLYKKNCESSGEKFRRSQSQFHTVAGEHCGLFLMRKLLGKLRNLFLL